MSLRRAMVAGQLTECPAGLRTVSMRESARNSLRNTSIPGNAHTFRKVQVFNKDWRVAFFCSIATAYWIGRGGWHCWKGLRSGNKRYACTHRYPIRLTQGMPCKTWWKENTAPRDFIQRVRMLPEFHQSLKPWRSLRLAVYSHCFFTACQLSVSLPNRPLSKIQAGSMNF
ncbi:hypothetical protein SAMN05216332_108136 [Nitrosospira briensis]|nr:hypothetical protein SAMN05216332_108136 [Nitrosospira briensis]